MRAGRFRHRIRIEVATVSRSEGTNAATKTWSTFNNYRNVPAGIEPLRGRELEAAGQRKSETVTRVPLRYLPGIVSGMRVVDERDDTVYEVIEILNENERNRGLELGCSRGFRLADA